MSPIPHYRRTLTGRVKGRLNLFRQVIMQVEVMTEVTQGYPAPPPRAGSSHFTPTEEVISTYTEWRDATAEDFMGSQFKLVLPAAAPQLASA